MSDKGEMHWREVATLMRDALNATAERLADVLRQNVALLEKVEDLINRLTEAEASAAAPPQQRRWEGRGEELDDWRSERLRNAYNTLEETGADASTTTSIEVGPGQYRSYTKAELQHLLNGETGAT